MQAGLANPVAGDLVIPAWPVYPALIGSETSEAPASSEDLSSASSEAMFSQPDPMHNNGCIGRVGNGSGGGPGPDVGTVKGLGCLVQGEVPSAALDASIKGILACAFDILLGDGGATAQDVVSVISQIDDLPMSHQKYGTLLKLKEALGKVKLNEAESPSRMSRNKRRNRR